MGTIYYGWRLKKIFLRMAITDIGPEKVDGPEIATLREGSPRNWPTLQKAYIVFLVSSMAFIGQLASMVNPDFVVVAKDLNVTVQQASYITTVYILFTGVTPMFLAPLANIYGRRILYIVFTLIAILANIGSALGTTYGGVMVGRVFNGIGASVPLGFGAATICDLFEQSVRGKYMGFYALCLTNAPHVAPILGGYVAMDASWRWSFYVPAIAQSIAWVLTLFTLPETLYSERDGNRLEGKTYWQRFFYVGKVVDRNLRPVHFLYPFRMV